MSNRSQRIQRIRPHHLDDLVIRPLAEADLPELQRLAERDGATTPALPALGAESGGRLLAAVILPADRAAEHAVIADPFQPSAGASELLRLRAGQLRHDADGERWPRLAASLRRARAA